MTAGVANHVFIDVTFTKKKKLTTYHWKSPRFISTKFNNFGLM